MTFNYDSESDIQMDRFQQTKTNSSHGHHDTASTYLLVIMGMSLTSFWELCTGAPTAMVAKFRISTGARTYIRNSPIF